MKILVIEDHPTELKLAHLVLRGAVSEVVDGEAAEHTLAFIKEDHPELILLDLVLPDIDGLAFVRRVKSDPDLRDIYVVAVASCPEQYSKTSALSAGCDAYLVRPIAPAEPSGQLAAAAQRGEQSAGNEKDHWKLLIVDDIAANRKVLRVMLEAEGHATFEAADGVEALQILARKKVDAVLSDIMMPRMDGYRLCHEIRAKNSLRNLPIVIYTSTYTSLNDEKLALSLGADQYLKKPAPAKTILAALREAIAIRQAAPRAGTWQNVDALKEYSDRLVAKLQERNVELEQRLRLVSLAADVGSALTHGKTLQEILQRCAEALVRHLDGALCRIWIPSRRDKVLELRASAGMDTPLDRQPGRVPIGQFNARLIAEERKPHVTNSVIDDPRVVSEREWARREGLAAFVGHPLIVGDRVAGVIAMFARDSIPQTALDAMASVASALALGIDRNRLDEELRSAHATLLQEVHHRVNNNLQMICSLLSMQIEAAPDGDRFSKPLNDAHSRVLAMSLIQRQVYRSETLTDLNFDECIEMLSDSLSISSGKDPSRIRLELDLETIRLDLNHAIACGLILNELLSNSLKHAFRDGREGSIRISFRKTEDGHVELTVADNGVGLPLGFRLEESRSLGLQVVQILLKQLRAEACVTGEGGVTFAFSWKLPEPENLPAIDLASHTIGRVGAGFVGLV